LVLIVCFYIFDGINQTYWCPFLTQIFLIILVLFYFFKYLKQDAVIDLAKDPIFWLCVGILLCAIGLLPYNLLMLLDFIYVGQEIKTLVLIPAVLAFIIRSIFFTKAFLCLKKTF
jgi:hypothetical protein